MRVIFSLSSSQKSKSVKHILDDSNQNLSSGLFIFVCGVPQATTYQRKSITVVASIQPILAESRRGSIQFIASNKKTIIQPCSTHEVRIKYDAILDGNDVIDHEIRNIIEIKIRATFFFKSIYYFYGLFE